MKALLRFAFIAALVLANVGLVQAQSANPPVVINDPADWTTINIFGLNAIVVVRFLGEIYAALKNGGGILGIFRAIIYGANVPKPIAVDYKEELKADPK